MDDNETAIMIELRNVLVELLASIRELLKILKEGGEGS